MNETTNFTLGLLRLAAEKGIPFAVVRGVESKDSPPGDADIISPDKMGIRDLIREYCSLTNSLMLPTISRHYVDIYRILLKGDDGHFHAAKIDVHNGEQWRGIVYVDAVEATINTRTVMGVPHVSFVHSIISNIMQISLPGIPVFASRAARIEKAMGQLNLAELRELGAYFEGIGAFDTVKHLQNCDVDAAARHIYTNRLKIWVLIFFRHPVRTMYNVGSTAWRKLVYFIIPPGIFLAVVGPDGAGKSTLISALRDSLGIWTAKDLIRVQHWRPSFMKPLAIYKRKAELTPEQSQTTDALAENENMLGMTQVAMSLFRFIYYVFDYILGYWLVTRRLLTKEGIVICDRYVDDYIIAPKERSRVGLPMLVKRIITFFVPRPSLRFYLRGEPSLLYSRKTDETICELTGLVQQYDLYCGPNRGYVVLDATLPVVEIRDTVLKRLSK